MNETLSESLAQWFTMGGAWMYPVALVGCAGVPLSVALLVVGLAVKTKPLAVPMALGLVATGLLPMAVGVAGYASNMASARQAISYAAPEDRDIILAAATGESLSTVEAGLFAGLLPLCVGLALLGIGLSRRGEA